MSYYIVEVDNDGFKIYNSVGTLIDPATDASVQAVTTAISAIKDTAGIKKIVDALPTGTNEIGKVAQGTKAAAAAAWPFYLVDNTGNVAGIVLDGVVYRVQTQSKIVRASDGTQINPATEETLEEINTGLASAGPVVPIWGAYPNDANQRPIAGRGIGGWVPEPTAYLRGPEQYNAGPFLLDAVGNLVTRAQVLTDEESFRNDFSGASLDSALTGTLVFTNGSPVVTGTGTAFLTELNNTRYIKRSSHALTYWTRIRSIDSDTELELDADYGGATSTGEGHSTFFPTLSADGISVGSSELTIASGTTVSDQRGIKRDSDYGPILLHVYAQISQRIAGQEGRVGFADASASPQAQALIIFTGTDNTKVTFRTSGDGTLEETEVTLPSGYTSASELEYVINVLSSECSLSVEGICLARHVRHIPQTYATLTMCAYWVNSNPGPASSSNMVLDTVYISNHNRIEICQKFMGDTIPVQNKDDTHTIIAKRATTATSEVELIAYTVPTGKTFWLAGYNISAGTTTVNATFKIGKGAIPLSDPTNPGTADSSLIRGIFLLAKTTISEQMNSPLYVAAAGETVRVSVTPDGTTNTTWRCSLDFILR